MNEALSLELKADEERLVLLIRKRAEIQRGFDLATDNGQRFKYQEELCDLDKEIAQLKEKIHGLEGALTSFVTPWQPLLEHYGVYDEMRLSDTVNCNRETHYGDGLWAHFKQQAREKNNLFYAIVACPYQRPASIAKRLVYEIEEKKMRIARMADAACPQEVAVSDMTLGMAPEHTWQLLWEVMRNRLGAPGQLAATPADLAAQCADKDRIAWVCRLHVRHWEQDTLDHLRYVIGQFQGMAEASRKYLLLLAVEFPHIHTENREKHAEKLAQLAGLWTEVAANGLQAACFSLLPPVSAESVEDWSSHVLVRDKKAAFKAILTQLQEGRQEDCFDMERVEGIQEAAWKYRNRPRPDLSF